MPMLNPLDELCYHDPRNPMFTDLEDYSKSPRQGCTCDNCFYGRDAMALELIRYSEALEKLACLGNGNRHGNSIGNQIAIDALEGR